MLQPIFFQARHGRTAGNESGKYRGWSNGKNAQLDSKLGIQDAREAGIWMLRSGAGKIDLIVCDDLDRTRHTAEIIGSIINAPVSPTPELRPLNVGDFTGKSKAEYPLEAYLTDKNKVIPGGESVNQFNHRQAVFYDKLITTIEETQKRILTVGHGSNMSFLYTAFNGGSVGYEGLVDPGGLAALTSEGLVALFKSRGVAKNPLADGTALSGFVTDEENRPPRECWNCRHFVRDLTGLGGCQHLLVRLDPELQSRKQTDGTIAVGDRDCCNEFQNKVAS